MSNERKERRRAKPEIPDLRVSRAEENNLRGVLNRMRGTGIAPEPGPKQPAPTQQAAAPLPSREGGHYLTKRGAPARGSGEPLPEAGAPQQVAPTHEEGATWLKITSPYIELPHAWTDVMARTYGVYAQTIYVQLFRLSYGHHRDWCQIGYPKLAERSGISVNSARSGARELAARGLVEQVTIDVTNPAQEHRGIRWRVNLPDGAAAYQAAPAYGGAPTRRAPMKRNLENNLEKASTADAATPDIYGIRKAALRMQGGVPGEGNLRESVEAWLIGEGHHVEQSVIEEALLPLLRESDGG